MKGSGSERISGFGTSVFTEITRLAMAHGAVNLGQGFPDFPAPDFIKEAARRAVADDHNQYAPAPGLLPLRQAIASRFEARHGRQVDPGEEITVAAGATEAIFDAVMGLVNPGDEVIVFEPCYDAYVPDIQMAGGRTRVVTLRPPHWSFDPDELRAAFGPHTRLIIVNSPHNPTGKVFTGAELDLIAELCQRHDVLALCDEVYSEIVYAGHRHIPLATRPGMWERTITIDSLGKAFSVTGWKIGWAIAPAPLTRPLRAVHQWITFCVAAPFQMAAAEALATAESVGYFRDLVAAYTRRRDRLAAILAGAHLPSETPQGSYFLLADISQWPFADDAAFCSHLITQVGVAAIPPSAFYADPRTAPKLARFCFAKKDETLEAAAMRLATLAAR